jgi:sugar phosphate permease
VPFANSTNILAICFAIVGFCQGPLVSSVNVLLAKWIPPNERAEAVTLVASGHTSGRLLATLMAGGLASTLGWRYCYAIYGILSAILLLFWRGIVTREPAVCPHVSEQERHFLLDTCAVSSGASKKDSAVGRSFIAVRSLLAATPAWAIILCHIVHNFSTYTLANWGPSYYTEVFSFSPRDASYLATLPNICGWIMQLTCKRASITLQSEYSWSLLGVRKLFTGTAFLGSGCLFVVFAHAQTPVVAVCCQCGIVMIMTLHSSGYVANYLDVGGANSGLLSGVGNTVANIPGFAGPPLTAWMLKRSGGEWAPVFYLTVVFAITATSVYTAYASVRAAAVANSSSSESATEEVARSGGGFGGGGGDRESRKRQKQFEMRPVPSSSSELLSRSNSR